MIVREDALAAIDFEGLSILDYTAGQPVSSSFAVIDVPPGSRHREAMSSRSDKYYYLVRGALQFALDGVEHALAAGDFCLVRRGQRFSYRNMAGEAARLVLVHTPSFDLAAEVFLEEGPHA